MKILILFLVLIVQSAVGQSENPTATTIILIRHAEKGNDGSKNPPLSEDGLKRAARLVEIMQNTAISAIYSTNYIRTINSVTPIALSKGLAIKAYEPMKEEEIKAIVAANKGGTILICGHSNTTPWTANFLTGQKLLDFKDTEYGNILIVTFWDFGNATLTRLNY